MVAVSGADEGVAVRTEVDTSEAGDGRPMGLLRASTWTGAHNRSMQMSAKRPIGKADSLIFMGAAIVLRKRRNAMSRSCCCSHGRSCMNVFIL